MSNISFPLAYCKITEDIFTPNQIIYRIIVPIVFTLIVLVGFVGNVLVIIVVLANIQMRNTTNLLIISLALADLAFIVFCVPFTAVYYVMGSWVLGDIMCKIYNYTIYFTAYCSVYTLVLMSFDRYLAVVHPIESRSWRTMNNTIIAVVLIWLLFLITHIPLLINTKVVLTHDPTRQCFTRLCKYRPMIIENTTTFEIDENKEFGKVYYGLFFLFGYILPFVAICLLYGFLIWRLLFARTAKISQSEESARNKRRVTLMVVVVIAVFGFCWLPIQLIFMYQHYGSDPHNLAFRIIHVIANCLVYANSSINPILYAFLSENFRKAFARILCFKKASRSNGLDYERTCVSHHMRAALTLKDQEARKLLLEQMNNETKQHCGSHMHADATKSIEPTAAASHPTMYEMNNSDSKVQLKVQIHIHNNAVNSLEENENEEEKEERVVDDTMEEAEDTI